MSRERSGSSRRERCRAHRQYCNLVLNVFSHRRMALFRPAPCLEQKESHCQGPRKEFQLKKKNQMVKIYRGGGVWNLNSSFSDGLETQNSNDNCYTHIHTYKLSHTHAHERRPPPPHTQRHLWGGRGLVIWDYHFSIYMLYNITCP